MASKLHGVNATIIIFVFVFYCISLSFILLYCTLLYCIVLYCIVLCFIVLYCFVFYCIVLKTTRKGVDSTVESSSLRLRAPETTGLWEEHITSEYAHSPEPFIISFSNVIFSIIFILKLIKTILISICFFYFVCFVNKMPSQTSEH